MINGNTVNTKNSISRISCQRKLEGLHTKWKSTVFVEFACDCALKRSSFNFFQEGKQSGICGTLKTQQYFWAMSILSI